MRVDSPSSRLAMPLAAVFAATATVVTGCADDSAPKPTALATLPATTPTPTPSPSTDKDAVLTVYRELYRVGPRAEQARPEERKAILEPIVTQPLLGTMLKGIAALRAKGRVTYGYPTFHTFKVEVQGDGAVVHDCQDGRNGGQADFRTGKHLTHGMPGTYMVAALAKEADGAWRVAKVEQLDAPCSPAA
ncbi:hypothetical protein ABZ897_55625 [Nonomuraea sp. NPDC046802]|uniref:hypothetical protein n=1 Tax=Nonomuraea sp. NPDC046802 TaxID=3154919 RepID=UPI0033EF4EC0